MLNDRPLSQADNTFYTFFNLDHTKLNYQTGAVSGRHVTLAKRIYDGALAPPIHFSRMLQKHNYFTRVVLVLAIKLDDFSVCSTK